MAKIPAFQFYPADWRKDPGVQALSFFDRGVWFEILCLMHESEQRGKLLLNGKPMPEEALARLLGLDKQALLKTLATLLDYGVARRDDNGILFSKRMVEDEQERLQNNERQRRFYEKANGRPGGGLNEKPNGQPNANLTDDLTQTLHASSSSPSSSKELNGSGGSFKARAPAPAREESGTAAASADKSADFKKYLAELQQRFPEKDVSKVLKKMRDWCKLHAKDPTRQRLEEWLETEHDPLGDEFLAAIDDSPPDGKPAWRVAIENCSLCDERGMVKVENGMKKCRHEKGGI